MRVTGFLIYLCFLLIGGNYSYADTQNIVVAYSSSQNVTGNQQTKFLYKDQGVVVIEDTDFDIEEDLHSDKTESGDFLFINGYSLPHKWYLSFSGLSVLYNYQQSFSVSKLIFDDSSPIYLRNRVLRI